jgi:hypothetical protein
VVTGSLPTAGARVAAGTSVTLVLTTVSPPAGLLSHRASRLAVPSFVGERVSAASRWASVHHLSLVAHLGRLRRGDAPWLLAGYVITAQLPRPGQGNRAALTLWGRQPTPPAPTKPAPPPPPSAPPPAPPSTPTTITPPSPSPPPPVTYFQNPVYSDTAFADPFVLDNGNTHSDYWAFSTGDRFPVLHSPDLVHWTAEPTAMTSRPSWVVSSDDWHPWAPSLIQLSPPCPTTGCYIMYYVGADASLSSSAGWLVNCIGVATATNPGGPYTDQGPLTLTGAAAGTMPVGCGDTTGEGNIDPSPFIDASTGQAYLYVSTERGEVNGQFVRRSTVSVIPLDPGLTEASGPRAPLLTGAANTWEDGGGSEGPTVEGPFMELHNGTYYLFYSGGNWGWIYGMGYATGQSPTGPFTKSSANPILAETASVFSPGGGDRLVTGPHGGLWLVYHARANSRSDPRTLRIDPLSWKPANPAGAPDVPVIGGPTSTPQSIQP